jgi:hypothetical protein
MYLKIDMGRVASSCEHNYHSSSKKGGEFIHRQSDYQLLKKDSVPCSQSSSVTVELGLLGFVS